MAISVADYVFQRVAEEGVKDVFMVSGGGIMYLCDALGRSPDLRYWCNYHEQACAIAAEGYARVTEGLGVCLVTTGPGSTNALSGVAGAWVDSIPVLVISGQVRTAIMADYDRQRQVGPQEINITPMAAPVTKHAVTVTRAEDLRYELEKCLYLARAGRPGPVWLNLPLDIQSALIEPEQQRAYVPEGKATPELDQAAVAQIADWFAVAKRPVILYGNGIVLGGARQSFRKLVADLRVPAMSTISAMDALAEDDPCFQGRIGPGGQRRANFALQNADLVLAIGTSLSIAAIGFSDKFAPKAKKILVNIDEGDLEKRNITIDLPVLADANEFIAAFRAELELRDRKTPQRWLDACAMWKREYPPMPSSEHLQKEHVDIYAAYDELSRQLGDTDIVVSGNSLDGCIIAYQNHRVKDGQVAFTSACMGAMGWDLPALVGACIADDRKRRGVLVTGDGSVLFNIQELMFLGHNRLNAKLFISNNDGYQSIRNTQTRFFDGRQVGTDVHSGVGNPNFEQLAAAFHLKYLRIATNAELKESIARVFADDEPWIVEMLVSQQQQRFRASSYRKPDGTLASRPMEDMDPLLAREELERNMTMFDND
ncbi:thiamine pyrophosphate-binding protein [Trinickia violacea]|uniref:Thiamine pyrophosphate-binding protein n=1 Tax=Trinickia violacea TaxID=2571746 RepID=A0A4P8IY68_9BURK|nr:thiamine pyrophosphate-binding protein [Trinickia violacea]QCP53491.1 thiamine pyrophosphate-binding protein [Trinickia violacea]